MSNSLVIEDLTLEEAEIVGAGQLTPAQEWEIAAVFGVIIIAIVAL